MANLKKAYRPYLPFTTALIVLKPTITNVQGVRTKTLPAVTDGFQINASFKTYGGTETDVNGVYSIIDTADVETWYTPEITSDCVIVVATTGARYEIINEPENIEMRNQFLKFKIRRVKGGA